MGKRKIPEEAWRHRTIGPNRRQRRANGRRDPYSKRLISPPSQNTPYRVEEEDDE